MSRLRINPLVLLLIGLAIFGFMYTLITDPMRIITQVLIFSAIAFVLFFLYKRFLAKQYGMPKQSSHRPIKKASNIVPHRSKNPSAIKRSKPLQKRKTEHNFKVIEGKKNKKKNRALF
ncbi:SA1362 family protein [Alkalihalobacterium bogoriense]|uniref:SA1362 family protein n=1 Tax=Alkalihalobacterium bogoriense TaxID=246272 RepID=UPI0004795C94|nr:SA1362 family protein [Alkalihalobacterium bogoriense]